MSTLKLLNSELVGTEDLYGIKFEGTPELLRAVKVFIGNHPVINEELISGDEVVFEPNTWTLPLFQQWLKDHETLNLTDYEYLDSIQQDHALGIDFYKHVIDTMPYTITNKLCIVPKRALRSKMVEWAGEQALNRLDRARTEIAKRFPKSTLRILRPMENVTVIGAHEDSIRIYTFCEYKGDYTKPWTDCVIAWLDDHDIIQYRTVARSAIRPFKSNTLTKNDLGQSIVNSMGI